MELESGIRQIYRVPIRENEDVHVIVDGSRYDVVNLGSDGIGIRVPEPPPFSVDRVYKITLLINGELLYLSGKIIHVTPFEADQCLCGIRSIDIDENSHQQLLEYVSRIRANLFTKG